MNAGPASRRKKRKLRSALAAAAALAMVVAASGTATGADHVVAGGFVSPLGFAVGSDGTLYVAEAFIGQVTAVSKSGQRSTLVSGPEGQFTAGVDAKGKGTVSYTLSLPPEFQDGPPTDTTLNRVRRTARPCVRRRCSPTRSRRTRMPAMSTDWSAPPPPALTSTKLLRM